jgi:hypothetical protein
VAKGGALAKLPAILDQTGAWFSGRGGTVILRVKEKTISTYVIITFSWKVKRNQKVKGFSFGETKK